MQKRPPPINLDKYLEDHVENLEFAESKKNGESAPEGYANFMVGMDDKELPFK